MRSMVWGGLVRAFWCVMNITTRMYWCCRSPMLFSSCKRFWFFYSFLFCGHGMNYYWPQPRPGDYLQHDHDEVEGFKARLNERLAPVGSQFTGEGVNEDWEIGDTLAQWWRPNFETFMYPFLPGHVTRPKECKKLYFIQLPKKSGWNMFYLMSIYRGHAS